MRVISKFISLGQIQRLKPKRVVKSLIRRLRRIFVRKLPSGEVWTKPVDVAVICPSYPSDKQPYGGQFIQSRVISYQKSGLSVVVIVSRSDIISDYDEVNSSVPVWRTCPSLLKKYLKKGLCKRVVIHHPEAENWGVILPTAPNTKPIAIFHGYEARPWRTLESSYTLEEREELGAALDMKDSIRQNTVINIFNNSYTTPIFVSQTMKSMAEKFSGKLAPAHAKVIHNPVLEHEFTYREKRAEERFSILWMRSFQSYNYANDLSCKAIIELSKRPGFDRFNIMVCGDGLLWEEITTQLSHLKNVIVKKGFVLRSEVTKLHNLYGVMLVPSRWESQGLTLCEAMASGLVPVTTKVAAVPEFVSDLEGRLCDPENATSLTEAIIELADNPTLFQALSKRASERSKLQCGWDQTVGREIELIKASICS